MSLLQPPPRSPSAGLDLGRELDLSSERPAAAGRATRGPGVLVAAIVASSLALAGIIMLVRDDGSDANAREPSAPPPMTRSVSIPAQPPAVAPAEPTPATPSRVASQPSHPSHPSHPGPSQPPSASAPEITPAAIAPASPRHAAALPDAPGPATAVPAPGSGLAPGLDLPAPVFDEPAPEPTSPVVASPEPDLERSAPEPLPGVEDGGLFEPEPEPPIEDAPEAAAVHPLDRPFS